MRCSPPGRASRRSSSSTSRRTTDAARGRHGATWPRCATGWPRVVRRPIAARTSAAVAIVMRQRPAMVAAELGAMALGRTALLVSPLAGRSRAGRRRRGGPRPAVLVAHTTDWARPGFADAVMASGALGLAVADDGAIDGADRRRRRPAGPGVRRRRHGAHQRHHRAGRSGCPSPGTTFSELGGGPIGRRAEVGQGCADPVAAARDARRLAVDGAPRVHGPADGDDGAVRRAHVGRAREGAPART